jgi:hypothetical protein
MLRARSGVTEIPGGTVDGLQQGSLVPARAVADGTAAVARMVLPLAPGLALTAPS